MGVFDQCIFKRRMLRMLSVSKIRCNIIKLSITILSKVMVILWWLMANQLIKLSRSSIVSAKNKKTIAISNKI